ncbi:MAG: hypothetical protein COW16_01805 [Sphingomonadales bacterium CG12_big_fil_rev_8_21_14_0_65_65_10]|nr:MAG: hypothetical protein COW16_01805 [Sphingomonadales bacterium CG12_big_fil_rev_8_21_14_0_65_65_10]
MHATARNFWRNIERKREADTIEMVVRSATGAEASPTGHPQVPRGAAERLAPRMDPRMRVRNQ